MLPSPYFTWSAKPVRRRFHKYPQFPKMSDLQSPRSACELCEAEVRKMKNESFGRKEVDIVSIWWSSLSRHYSRAGDDYNLDLLAPPPLQSKIPASSSGADAWWSSSCAQWWVWWWAPPPCIYLHAGRQGRQTGRKRGSSPWLSNILCLVWTSHPASQPGVI